MWGAEADPDGKTPARRRRATRSRNHHIIVKTIPCTHTIYTRPPPIGVGVHIIIYI